MTFTFTTDDEGAYEFHTHIYDPDDNDLIGGTSYHYVSLSGAGTYTFTFYYENPVPAGTVLYFSTFHTHSELEGDTLPQQGQSYPCSDSSSTSAPAAGCDVSIDIPETAVGATITTSTLAYWKPGETTNTVLSAGTNVRAISQRDGYYKILYVCDFLYVPVSTLGPNYEAPWLGAPLPAAE